MDKILKIVGGLLVFGGAGLMGIGLGADYLGLSDQSGLGAKQLLLIAFGFVTLLGGVAFLTSPGRRLIVMSVQSLEKLRTWYKIHKWTTIVTGVVIVMWLITGMVMGWHKLFPEAEAAESPHLVFSTVDMSPADAARRLEELQGQPANIQSMDLRLLMDTVVYDIWLRDGNLRILDTQSGELVKITPELAQEIALAEAPIQADITGIERVTQHNFSYRFGPLPVYRVIFNDANQTYAYVRQSDGRVSYLDRWDRIQRVFHDTHTFNILQTLSLPGRPLTLVLWAATIVTTFAALIGFYLALPRRWQISSTRRKK